MPWSPQEHPPVSDSVMRKNNQASQGIAVLNLAAARDVFFRVSMARGNGMVKRGVSVGGCLRIFRA